MIFYKETDFQDSTIGKIPKGWSIKTTKEIGEVITGITPSTLVEEYWNGDYPFVTPTDITEKKYVEKTERKVSTKGLEKGRIIPKDSVLVTCIASIGKIALAFEGCLTNQQINAILCKNEVNPHYVYYAIGFRTSVLESWAGKTTSPIVKKSLFEKFPIPMPTNPSEQRAIVGVLGVVDCAIELADRVVAQMERLKRGLMQQLLTRGIEHTETKQTPIGNIPKEWDSVPLKDVVLSYKNGIYKPSQFAGKGLPCVRMYNIVAGKINLENAALLEVTEQELDEFGVKAGDIIVNRVNTSELVGKAGVVPKGFGKATFESKNIRMRVDTKKVSPDFLAVFVQTKSYSNQLLSRAKTAVAQATVTQEDLNSVVIPLPPTLNEQEKIAEIISTIDTKLLLEIQEKERIGRIKRGLMDLLLTGKVRIKVD